MDIKTQIQQEAEKRSTVTVKGAKPWEQINHSKRKALKDFGAWLDTEIVQPLRKENEGLKEKAELMEKYAGEWQDKFLTNEAMWKHHLSLSEGEIERLKGALRSVAYPIKHLQDGLKEDERLDGMMAIQLSNDTQYLKGLAQKALEHNL